MGTPSRGAIPAAALRALQAATVGTPDSEARKSVRFHLRSNLYFDFGGKVPPPDVRTPPKAKPKVRTPSQARASVDAHACVLAIISLLTSNLGWIERDSQPEEHISGAHFPSVGGNPMSGPAVHQSGCSDSLMRKRYVSDHMVKMRIVPTLSMPQSCEPYRLSKSPSRFGAGECAEGAAGSHGAENVAHADAS